MENVTGIVLNSEFWLYHPKFEILKTKTDFLKKELESVRIMLCEYNNQNELLKREMDQTCLNMKLLHEKLQGSEMECLSLRKNLKNAHNKLHKLKRNTIKPLETISETDESLHIKTIDLDSDKTISTKTYCQETLSHLRVDMPTTEQEKQHFRVDMPTTEQKKNRSQFTSS